ncbi:MAG: threonine/serine dehydratase [Pseudomonadota bacterium]
MGLALPTRADVVAAAERIAGEAVRTPLLRSPALDARCGRTVLLKAETLQRTGSFKFRGAYNAVLQIPEARRAAGVVAPSSGNHAQGLAEAARLLGMPCTIVMPADAPALKTARTKALGATVRPYDRIREDRLAIAKRIRDETGATLVPPFDHPHVIAGQGTAGLEMGEQAEAMGLSLDAALVCCSGGGLAGGIGLALPGVDTYTVEPAGFDDMARSLRSGRRETNASASGSICDALLVQTPGEITFPVAQSMLAGGLVVTDEQALAAMAYAFDTLKLVVEPGGAVALAAVLFDLVPKHYRTVGVVLSGGNVDPALFSRAIQG